MPRLCWRTITASAVRWLRRLHATSRSRRLVRQAESKPLVEALKAWLESKLLGVSEKSVIAEAIRYGFNHRDGLMQFLADGRIEMDTTL